MNKVLMLAVASVFNANIALAQAPAAKPAAPPANPQQSCLQAIQKDNVAFDNALANAVKTGKIDPKEKAALDNTHADLLAAEKAAAADQNLSQAECKALRDKIAAQHKQFSAAMAAPTPTKPVVAPAAGAKPAVPAVPVKPAVPALGAKPAAAGPHPQQSCLAAIQRDNVAFGNALANGVKAGKIDSKEKAELEKNHADLLAAEKAAAADQNVSAAECKALQDKVAAQHKQFSAAMAAPVPAKPVAQPVKKP